MNRPAAAKINEVRARKRIASEPSVSAAYDQDYWAWTRAQARALKARRLQDLGSADISRRRSRIWVRARSDGWKTNSLGFWSTYSSSVMRAIRAHR